jgi:MFS family permease
VVHPSNTATVKVVPDPDSTVRDRAYEWKVTLLLSLGFGLVALDRYLILPMFPAIMRDLHLDYADLGNITGALAITWGLSAFVMGGLSDKHGRRKVVVGSMVTFSLLVGFSGAAQGVMSLICIRALMGMAEGAYVPPSMAATVEASPPSRHGLNIGLQQVTASLLSLGVAPIVVTQLMQHIDWRFIFLLVACPGGIVAWLLHRTLRELQPQIAAGGSEVAEAAANGVWQVFAYRNIPLAALAMVSGLTCLMVLSAFLPSYLVDRLHLSSSGMGYVMSAIGVGAVIGTVAVPALSDRVGRKPSMVISFVGAAVALVLLEETGAEPAKLFLWIGLTSFFNYALLVLIVGPIAMEAVPAKLRATASGAVIAIGELFGGGIAPSIAGYTARRFGIEHILYLAIGGLALGVIASLALTETAPAIRKNPE